MVKCVVKKEVTCPMRQALAVLGGKWAFSIVYVLLSGTLRFKELERQIEGINTRMLTKELKFMEQQGILIRQAYATVPPTVEYTLTEKGRAMEPILREMYRWGTRYQDAAAAG